jgi:hypothetical protein
MTVHTSDQRRVDLDQARFVVGGSLRRCGWAPQNKAVSNEPTQGPRADKPRSAHVDKSAALTTAGTLHLGHLQTCPVQDGMSASPLKADITGRERDFR